MTSCLRIKYNNKELKNIKEKVKAEVLYASGVQFSTV